LFDICRSAAPAVASYSSVLTELATEFSAVHGTPRKLSSLVKVEESWCKPEWPWPPRHRSAIDLWAPACAEGCCLACFCSTIHFDLSTLQDLYERLTEMNDLRGYIGLDRPVIVSDVVACQPEMIDSFEPSRPKFHFSSDSEWHAAASMSFTNATSFQCLARPKIMFRVRTCGTRKHNDFYDQQAQPPPCCSIIMKASSSTLPCRALFAC
jgi:hypothetical protein